MQTTPRHDRARDAEETRHFYEDILGLPLYHIIQSDYVPSTGEYCPYTHFFFRLQDGSFIAFFDLGDDEAALPSPNTPKWVNHISFRVNTVDEPAKILEIAKAARENNLAADWRHGSTLVAQGRSSAIDADHLPGLGIEQPENPFLPHQNQEP